MSAQPLRIVIQAPAFFAIDPKKLRVEETEFTGRVYFIDKKDRIVAVGERKQ